MHELRCRNQLFSFYYIRESLKRGNKHVRFGEMINTLTEGIKLGYRYFLDSGAYTFHVAQKKQLKELAKESGIPPKDIVGKEVKDLMEVLDKAGVSYSSVMTPVKTYMADYMEFVELYGHLFFIIAELDIEGCLDVELGEISIEQVDAWTNQLLNSRHGTKIMPVYHFYRGRDWLQDWLLDTGSPYIGVGSDPVRGEEATALIHMAHKCGKWIHGFGQAALKTTLKRRPFDSIDATTWLRADRYGGSFLLHQVFTQLEDGEVIGEIFSPKDIVVLTNKEKHRRLAFKDFYKKWGLDIEKVKEDEAYKTRMVLAKGKGGNIIPKLVGSTSKAALEENRKATLIAWREIAKFYEEKVGMKTPYLWDMAVNGELPLEHPLITQLRRSA